MDTDDTDAALSRGARDAEALQGEPVEGMSRVGDRDGIDGGKGVSEWGSVLRWF